MPRMSLHSHMRSFFSHTAHIFFFLHKQIKHTYRHTVAHSKSKYRPAASAPPGPIQLRWSCPPSLCSPQETAPAWVCCLLLMSQHPPANLSSAVLLTTHLFLLHHLWPAVSLANTEELSPLFCCGAAVSSSNIEWNLPFSQSYFIRDCLSTYIVPVGHWQQWPFSGCWPDKIGVLWGSAGSVNTDTDLQLYFLPQPALPLLFAAVKRETGVIEESGPSPFTSHASESLLFMLAILQMSCNLHIVIMTNIICCCSIQLWNIAEDFAVLRICPGTWIQVCHVLRKG